MVRVVRCPDSVDLYLEDTEVSKLFLYYEDAIKQIFQFYASQAEIRTKGEGSPRKGGLGSTNTMKEALGWVTASTCLHLPPPASTCLHLLISL